MPDTYGGSWHGATLLIGSGENTSGVRPDVTLLGDIDSRYITNSNINTPGRVATVQTQGANFIVTGGIGRQGIITNINAWDGNITLKHPAEGELYIQTSAINANLASARNGMIISAESTGEQSLVQYVDLGEGSTIALTGENSQLVVQNPIGAKDPLTGFGGIVKGSTLQAVEQISLLGGVIQGAGDIVATESTIAASNRGENHPIEVEQPTITQGGADPLNLTAQLSIVLGEVLTNSLHSKEGDILAGLVISAITKDQAGQIYVNPYRASGTYFPRYGITANEITANNLGESSSSTEEKGRVIVGEINMPLSEDASANLAAGHLYVSKVDGRTSNAGDVLPASTGNVSIKTGTLTLTSANPLKYNRVGPNNASETITRDYASEIGGDMILDDVASNFTSLEVIGASNLTGGRIGKKKMMAH